MAEASLLNAVIGIRSTALTTGATKAFLDAVNADVAFTGGTDLSIAAFSSAEFPIRAIFEAVRLLYREARSRGTSADAFTSALRRIGVTDAAVDALHAGLLSKPADDAALSALAMRGQNSLLSFDWKVQHTLSSAQLANVGQSSVEVSLCTCVEGVPTSTTVELSAVELSAVISQLERAVAAADSVQSR